MIAFLLAALLALPAQAQEAGVFNSSCFLGINDSQTAATLPNCESPDALNTESNLDGTAILKRKGFAKTADLTISTSPVTGSHSFIDSSGNRLDIVCQDRNCAKSTNGNAFSTFLTTAASGVTRWSFVDQGGILYGANNRFDPIMRYDGTTRTSPTGMPLGSILALTQDRLAIGDITTLPNRVHYSSAGAYEQFTVGVNPEDSFFDDFGADGDRVRGIKCIQGNCFIFKTASITICEMADQYNTRCSVISPNIGTTDPASIVAAGQDLYFRAQDKNYWKIGRNGVEQISKKIPVLVKSQSGGLGGGENTNTQTTQADWQAGDQEPNSSWDTTTTNGSIFPSSVTLLDSTDSEFASGSFYNTSTWTTTGYLVTAPSNTARITDNFSDETLTNPTWTLDQVYWQAGRIGIANASIGKTVACRAFPESTYNEPNFINGMRISDGIPYGTWSASIYSGLNSGSASSLMFMFQFLYDATGRGYLIRGERTAATGVYRYTLAKTPGNGVTTEISAGTVSLAYGEIGEFKVTRSTSGVFQTYFDDVFSSSGTDLTYAPTNPQMLISIGGVNSGCSDPIVAVSTISASVYASTGHYISRVFDTAFSTPVGGTFTVSSTVPSGTTLAFGVRSAASAAGLTGSFAAITNGERISQVNRYWQYVSSFTTTVGTQTAQISDISLIAATTGQFITQCIQPNASITAWGTLSCAETKTGNASLVYYATSAVTCAALPTSTAPVNAQGAAQAGWTAQTNNATVTIATNSAVFIGWRSLLTSATEQAQVDACVLSWNEGTPSQPAWAAFDSVNSAIYWTTTINNHTSSNRLLKYDMNLDQWYPFDIPAQAPRVINNSLYFGGASSGTWNLYGLVDSDAGNAINAYWTSKDIGSDRPFQEKDFKTLSIMNRNQGTGSMTGTWTNSIGNTGSYTISLSTGAGISYARSNFNLPKKSPQNFMKIRLGNNNATPFEVLGIGLTWQVLPWRVAP